jgi:glycosyltransferase involved in cell wall biosynthesis
MKSLYQLLVKHKKTLLKYLFSGGTAAFVDLLALYLLTSVWHVHYLLSAIIAFIIAFFVSFSLQKFWTFEDKTKDRIHIQAFSYLLAGLTTLIINTILVYLFVHFIHLHYILAQIIASAIIAVINFVIYRFFIFKRNFSHYSPEALRLLIVTQKVDINDDVLGFAHNWILEFSKQTQSVIVICLEMGEHHLPPNVKVFSLGKEKERSKLSYIIRFYRLLWQERKNYDVVWIHMNQVYVILGWILWRIENKKIGLWYAHKAISFSLRVAEKMADVIFTSTKSGFRLISRKINIVGQGIDVKKFQPSIKQRKTASVEKKFTIISVARISPVKSLETLISAIDILKKKGRSVELNIIGAIALTEHRLYQETLKEMAKKLGVDENIHFIGSVPNNVLLPHLQSADIFVNTGLTGSLDKAGLEAMSVGLPLLTCNEAYEEVLAQNKDNMMFPKKDSLRLAEEIEMIINMNNTEREQLSRNMRERIVKNHSLPNLVKQIVSLL